MKNLFLTVIISATSLITNAQSVEDQAHKAGANAFANAMIRNVLIIVGIAVVFYLYKSFSKKNKDE